MKTATKTKEARQFCFARADAERINPLKLALAEDNEDLCILSFSKSATETDLFRRSFAATKIRACVRTRTVA